MHWIVCQICFYQYAIITDTTHLYAELNFSFVDVSLGLIAKVRVCLCMNSNQPVLVCVHVRTSLSLCVCLRYRIGVDNPEVLDSTLILFIRLPSSRAEDDSIIDSTEVCWCV